MANGTNGGASEGSAHTQQPGVPPGDLGDDIDRVDPEDVEIMPPGEMVPPAGPPDDSAATVNADLVDDPEELARTIEAASGERVEVVESGHEDGADPAP